VVTVALGLSKNGAASADADPHTNMPMADEGLRLA
jgi:hypothetical protein